MKQNKNRKFVKVSSIPATWIESDADVPDAEVREKFETNQRRSIDYKIQKFNIRKKK